MQNPPKTGTFGEQTFTVDRSHTIDFDGLPPVLSTPSLVLLLEVTARDALAPFLEPGESSVGVQIELEHLAPTPLGQPVTCTARVLQVDGPLVSFQISARDPHDVVARGLHQRRVISVERFKAHVAKRG